jgi:FkbM family methyltransferase
MLNSIVKSIFRLMGLDVCRRTSSFPSNPFDAQKKLLEGMGITRPVIFDVGGHRGETIRQYRARFPDAVVYSFEPFPDSLASLNKNFGDDPLTKIIPVAVAEQPGPRILYINDVDATNSLLPAVTSSRRYLPGKGTKGSIQVDATSIDEFVESHRVETIHILKMDIQGGELMALKGAQRALKEIQMPLIYTEIMFVPHYENQPLLNDIWDFLAGYGYSMFDVYYLQWANNGQLRYANALFVNTEVRKFLNDAHMEIH